MPAGSKQALEKPSSDSQLLETAKQQTAAAGKDVAPGTIAPAKPGAAERSPAFAQPAYYRQGVLVPGGLRNRPMNRGKNR
jgi:hypothetical protein